eukprot:GFUD01020865.1.p1 GENE.GFUD01020865.1~~GFUD01020865.1.p1  ORF type:complete len:508 (-),score=119.82 GFUD01020865.1:126-1649(-)
MKTLTAIAFLLTLIQQTTQTFKQPNIIVIVADDLGYNDVSWHNKEMLTPNLGNLAHNGVILEQSYVQPICTPTRSALMTGRYPIHTGRQHSVLKPEEPRGLFTNMTLLPEHLRQLGYSTHMVGKWHLGFCNTSYLPTRRGFDTYYGYYTGSQDYYKHTRMSSTKPRTLGYDFRANEAVDKEAAGKYSAHVFAEKAVEVITAKANNSKPLFLYLAFQSVHAPLQVPEQYEKPYLHIKNTARRTYSGMVLALDEAVGNITTALNNSGLAKNTLIIFTTDNGGQTLNGGNNFPLRGNKNTLWEGGTRGSAFIHGSMLKNPGRISHGLIHVTDWLPTLVTVAGGSAKTLQGIDGIDQWRALMMDKPSPRNQMLYNIDPDKTPKHGPAGAIRLGPYKLIRGDPGRPNGWIPPPAVVDIDNEEYFDQLQDIFINEQCTANGKNAKLLFNLSKDPLEKQDLSKKFPKIVKKLEEVLDEYAEGMIPPDDTGLVLEGNPSNFDNLWSAGWCTSRPN